MTDAFWTALFGNLPAIVAAIGVIFAARWARQTKYAVSDTKHELVTRDNRADGKLDVIHELTNSTLEAAKATIAVLERQNFDLRALNEQLETRVRLVEAMLRKRLVDPPPEDLPVVERPPS